MRCRTFLLADVLYEMDASSIFCLLFASSFCIVETQETLAQDHVSFISKLGRKIFLNQMNYLYWQYLSSATKVRSADWTLDNCEPVRQKLARMNAFVSRYSPDNFWISVRHAASCEKTLSLIYFVKVLLQVLTSHFLSSWMYYSHTFIRLNHFTCLIIYWIL